MFCFQKKEFVYLSFHCCLKVTRDYFKYCNYSLILLIIAKIHSFKKDSSEPRFESLYVVKCYRVFQLYIIIITLCDYQLRQHIAIAIILADQNHAMRYIELLPNPKSCTPSILYILLLGPH